MLQLEFTKIILNKKGELLNSPFRLI